MRNSSLPQDLRYAFRAMLRAPAFTVTALIALALGVGGTSAIFSVVDAVLLRPLPLGHPERLVEILHRRENPVAPANYLDWKQQSTAFEQMGAAEYWMPSITGDGPPEKVQGLRLTTGALALAGVRPAIGRLFVAGEDEPGREHEAVLAWGFWQRHFAGNRSIIGHTVTLDAEPYTIVGVMPPGFDYPMFWAHGVQLWAPLALGARSASRSGQSLRVLAKLKPGINLERARAEMAGIAARLDRLYPGTNRNVTVTPLRDLVVGDVRPALLVLLGAVGFVLLLACANVAHMLLARGAAREREITIRAALGASRPRIAQQLLTESVLLALMGGAIGLALAAYGVHALVALGGSGLPRADEIGLDARVVLFTVLVSVATGLIFGLAPASRGSRPSLVDSLREAGRGSSGSARQNRLRDLLVASEFALALVLLSGAGLAIRTFIALQSIDPGFNARGVLTMIVSVKGTANGAPGRRVAFMQQLLEGVRAVPGVARASAINHVPIIGDLWGLSFYIEGRELPKPGDAPSAAYRVMLPGYFDAMGIPFLRGRDVTAADRLGAPGVVVINEYMAKRYWPNEDPIGKRIALERPSAATPWRTVIGGVKNVVRSDWAAPPAEEVYVPWLQEGNYLASTGGHVDMSLIIRARCRPGAPCDAAALAPAVRNVVWSIDHNIPVSDVTTMEQAETIATARPRFTLVLLAAFAAIALALAAVGVYGVMSYAVSRRVREIGVRLALGADPFTVMRMVVREGMTVAVAGAAVGVAGALLLTRSMASFLYGVRPSDPLTFVGVSGLLLGAALLASFLPARRAARTDPLVALRGE